MYTITETPRIQGDFAEIFLFGDLHYGADAQDRKLVQESIEYILNTPNCYGVGVGDTLENAIAGKFGVIGETKSVEQSVREFKEDFLPLIKAGKFLGTVIGNHDIRVTKATGSKYDPIEEFFDDIERTLGITVSYGKPHLVINSRVGRSNFVGFITHGSGGGGTLGSVANAMLRSVNEISDADWYAQGHFHQEIIAPTVRRPFFDRQKKVMLTQEQTFISTGSNLKKDGYAAVARLRDGSTTNTIIELTASPNSNHTTPKSIQTRTFRGLKQEQQYRLARGL